MKSLLTLLPYYKSYHRSLILGVISVIIGGALSSINPWLVRAAVDDIRAGAATWTVAKLALSMIGIALVGGTFRFLMRELMNGLSRRIETDLRRDLYDKLLSLDAAYYGSTRTGELMARLTNDIGAVRMAAGPAIMYLISTIAGGLFALGFMVRIDGRLTVLAILPLTLLPVVMRKLGSSIHDRFEAVQEHFGALTTRVQENLTGTRIVRAYQQEESEVARFEQMSREYVRRNLDLAKLYGIMNPAFGLLAGGGAVIVLAIGGRLALSDTISVGSFVAFSMYLGMLTWPMISLGWVMNLFQRAAASMTRLTEVLNAEASVRDAADLTLVEAASWTETAGASENRSSRGAALGAPPEQQVAAHRSDAHNPSVSTRTVLSPRALPRTTAGRSIEFRDVSFSYPSRSGQPAREVLHRVSFRVEAGHTLAVVGATGSGKSTLLELIPRVYDPTEGEVLIDGVPTTRIPLAELRRELGVVPQESLLFSDTIRHNLQYGAADAADVTWAARVAQLDETVADFPGGYDTVLGERGINLSGGQKQRATLARALARHPSIVLLDDALAAVDTHTEAAILHGLREALTNRTAIIASHRVSAVREADQIVVLDHGRVVQTGRHDELMARGGRYAELLSRQQLEEEIEAR